MSWIVEFSKQAEKFFESLPNEKKRTLAILITLLGKSGNELRLPQSRALGKGLFELRETSFGLRMYYAYAGEKVIFLLAGGDKSSQEKDIEKARKAKKGAGI